MLEADRREVWNLAGRIGDGKLAVAGFRCWRRGAALTQKKRLKVEKAAVSNLPHAPKPARIAMPALPRKELGCDFFVEVAGDLNAAKVLYLYHICASSTLVCWNITISRRRSSIVCQRCSSVGRLFTDGADTVAE